MIDPTMPVPAARALPVLPARRDPRPGIAGLTEGEIAALEGELDEPAFRRGHPASVGARVG
jgi:hypothetical protein